MPVIVTQSPKGGSGKTTTSLILALTLEEHYKVTIIDADPNRPIKLWASGGNVPERLTVISDADEDNIIEKIEEAAVVSDFVIVDMEGTAAKIVLLAVSQADFVIIPTQGSPLDAAEASKGVRVIRQQEKVSGKSKPFAVLLTRTNSTVRARNLTHIQAGLVNAGIPVFETELNEREAFKSMFAYQKPLKDLNPNLVPNLNKAIENAIQLTVELLKELAPKAKKDEVAA